MAPDLTVAIVCTDNREMLRDCLESLVATTRRTCLDVWVVDNASSDGTSEMVAAEFPQAQLIRNATRLGFTSNNNLVLERARGRYAMLLNDDTLVLEGAIDGMVEFMDAHPEAAAAGSLLLNPDRSLQISAFRFPHPVLEAFHPFTDRWRVVRPRDGQPVGVDWVCGASLMVRREVIAQVGGLDPDFNPIYSEETDWCYRIRQAGGQIYYLPQAQIVHFGGQTMNRAPARRVELLYRKRALYFAKHGGPAPKWVFKISLWIASLMKLLVWGIMYPLRPGRAGDEIPLHWHMVRRALQL